MMIFLESRRAKVLTGSVILLYVIIASCFVWTLWCRDYLEQMTANRQLNERILKDMQQQIEELEQKVRIHVSQITDIAEIPLMTSQMNDIKKTFVDFSRTTAAVLLKEISGNSTVNDRTTTNFVENFRFVKKKACFLRQVRKNQRNALAKELAQRTQASIFRHQHPRDCDSTKKIACSMDKNCGFGCQMHHVLSCLIAGLALDRTIILLSDRWTYSSKGWDAYFEPVSNCCIGLTADSLEMLPAFSATEDLAEYQVLRYPVSPLAVAPAWAPFAVPKTIAGNISLIHERPGVWWIAQGLKYLWRLRKNVSKSLSAETAKKRLKKPYVGIHIRRTDKLYSEAKFHSLAEYMEKLEDYYSEQSFDTGPPKLSSVKRVYIATDDSKVFAQFRSSYNASYELHGDPKRAKSGSSSRTRFSDSALLGIIKDVSFLSQSDHIICTFSSNVCRLAYALMQVKNDRTHNFDSLDDSFWLQGSTQNPYRVRYAHWKIKPSELASLVNDSIVGVYNLWNGISYGKNLRTGNSGTFPSYKIEEILQLADRHFPL